MVSVRTISLVFLAFCLGVPFHIAESKTKCQQAIPREQWKARRALFVIETDYIPDIVVIHHATYPNNCTDFESCAYAMKRMQYRDMVLKNISDIIYNFCIGSDLNVYEGRGWGRTGNHARYLNNRSIGVCIIGKPESFSPEMENALITFLRCAKKRKSLYKDYKVITHQQVSNSICPGSIIAEKVSKWPQYERDLINLNINVSYPAKLPYPYIEHTPPHDARILKNFSDFW